MNQFSGCRQQKMRKKRHEHAPTANGQRERAGTDRGKDHQQEDNSAAAHHADGGTQVDSAAPLSFNRAFLGDVQRPRHQDHLVRGAGTPSTDR